jgi:hypothetical protein
MWIDALKSVVAQAPLEAKFLTGAISFRGTAAGIQHDVTGNVDAVLAIRASRQKPPVRLVIVHPDATAAKARQMLLGIAFAQILDRSNEGHHRGESGGIVFVTQQIVLTRELLAGIRVRNQSIGEVFKILPLVSTPPILSWNTLLVANPGRVLQRRKDLAGIRALVIDASHPRTLSHLPALLTQNGGEQPPVQIVLAPPSDYLSQTSSREQIWLWDPPAVATASSLSERAIRDVITDAERHYWLAGDSGFDAIISKLEGFLIGAFRLARNALLSGLTEAWSITTTQRGLSVPLEQAERAWRESRLGNRLCDRIELLKRTPPQATGELKSYLAVYWPQIVESLNEAYATLANRGEPEKFFTIAQAAEELLNDHANLRIVTFTQEEAPILAAGLSNLDDRFRLALSDGRMEIIHQREEARRIAEGRYSETILSSARSARYRYLDIFPSNSVHIICYPHEFTQDRSRVLRQHLAWEPYRTDAAHCNAGRLPITATSPLPRIPPWKVNVILHGALADRPKSQWEVPDSALDLEWMSSESMLQNSLAPDGVGERSTFGKTIIEDVNGEIMCFTERQLLNVYRPETGKLLRMLSGQAHIGDHIVLLLDDHLEGLFDRLIDSMDDRRPLEHTLRLERWRAAKERLYNRFNGDRREIFRELASSISVDYQALKAWFGRHRAENAECIGPLAQHDFVRVAELTGAYRDVADIVSTYQTVHLERVNRRRLGRALHACLRGLAGGCGFDQAMRTAQALDTEVEEVVSSVEMREIARIDTAD